MRGDRLTGDILSDLRAALIRQIGQQQRSFAAGRAIDLPPQVAAPLNPFGAGIEPGFEGGLATGYDGTVTLVPFTVGMSIVGDTDVVTGS